MGLGAGLFLPMGLAAAAYDRGSSAVWRFVEIAEAEQRKFSPDEYTLIVEQHQQNKRMRALAITTGVAGGLLFASGLTMLLLGARDLDTQQPRVRVAPALAPGHAGVFIRARF